MNNSPLFHSKTLIARALFSSMLIIFTVNVAIAETKTFDNVSTEQNAINAIEQEKNRQQELIDRDKYKKQTEELWKSFDTPLIQSPKTPIQKQDDTTQSKETCLALKNIRFIGIEHFPFFTRIAVKRHAKRFLNTCADMDTIGKLISSTNKLLFDKGYVTSRAHMIEQDISDGTLDISITAGFIEHYQLENISAWQAALTLPSGLLNYYYLDHGLDNLKMLRSNQASLKILPGDKIGKSEIQVNNQLAKAWYSQLTLRNEHTNHINNPSTNVSLDLENLLRSNDLWNLSVNESLKDRAMQNNKLISSSIWIPIRRSSIKFEISDSHFLNHVQGNNIIFRTTGSSYQQAFFTDYLLFKNNQSRLSAEWQLSEKDDDNFINDAKIDIQSGINKKQIVGLDYKVSMSEFLKAQLKTEIHRGNFTGFDTSLEKENTQHFQRKLHQAMLSYQKNAFQMGFDAYLQESSSPLINNERFSLYTSFIPGIVYIPAQEGQLFAAKFGYHTQVNGISYLPEIQLTHVKLKDTDFNAELSGIKLKGSLQKRNFSAILEVGKPIKTPQPNKNISGSLSLNLSF